MPGAPAADLRYKMKRSPLGAVLQEYPVHNGCGGLSKVRPQDIIGFGRFENLSGISVITEPIAEDR